jgi:activator of HSP90 ATPase
MKSIKQKIIFKAIPEDVYEALMDSKKHTKFSGSKAVISRKVGGKFSAYDEYIEGINLELVPGKKIVQRWRGSDWPEGHYSVATFEFKKIKEGTQLIFTQENVPDDQVKSISQGWIDFYWKPMKENFGW